MLIDEFVPVYEVVERHGARMPVSPERAYRALWEVDFARSGVIRTLFAARGLLRIGFREDGRVRIRLQDFLRAGFLLLGERPGEEIVVGVVRSRGARDVTPEQFQCLDAPGFVKVAMNFVVRADGDGSAVTTETRVHSTDARSRRRFARYWLVIGPFSALIRRRMLAALRAEVRGAQAAARGR